MRRPRPKVSSGLLMPGDALGFLDARRKVSSRVRDGLPLRRLTARLARKPSCHEPGGR